jgi:hypothetical protein
VFLHRTTQEVGPAPVDDEHVRGVATFTTTAGRHRWPCHTSLWELAQGWTSAAHTAPPDAGSGLDRLLIASAGTPPLDHQRTTVHDAECCYHEVVSLRPGTARHYLELVHAHREALAASFGWHLVGAFRTAMVHDSEAIVLWAVPTWGDWARWETAEAADPSVAIWRGHLDGVVRDWRATVMVAGQAGASTATRRAQR